MEGTPATTGTTSTALPAAAVRYAGARIGRVEDARLLTGTGTFVDDVSRPGMLHACFVRSPFARARIDAVDDERGARACRACTPCFVAADLNPGVREQWHTSIGPDVPEVPRPPLAEDEVRFVGDPVALVVAESRYVAEDAADLVVVDYEPLPAVVDYAAGDRWRRLGARGRRPGTSSARWPGLRRPRSTRCSRRRRTS